MRRKRTKKQVRRYDVFKLSIILVLLVLIVTMLLSENNATTVADTEIDSMVSGVDGSTISYPSPTEAAFTEAHPTGADTSEADEGSTQEASPVPVEDDTVITEGSSAEEAYPVENDTVITEGGSVEEAYPVGSEEAGQETILPTVSLPEDDVLAGGMMLFGTGQPGAQVQLYANEMVLGNAQVDGNGNYTIEVDLEPGLYDIDIAALDASGNPLDRVPALSLPVLARREESISSVVAEREEYSTLASGLEVADLADRLSRDNATYTLIAPTDSAYSALPIELILAWEANPNAYIKVLLHHLLVGSHTREELAAVRSMPTVGGTNIEISSEDTELLIDGIAVRETILVGNGAIHTVDQFSLPPLEGQIQPPIINSSSVSIDSDNYLTVEGTAEPGTRILLQVDGSNFGELATVDGEGAWLISGDLSGSLHEIVAYMIDDNGLLIAMSQPEIPPAE